MRHTARRFSAAVLTVLGALALLVTGLTGSAQAAPVTCEYPAAVCEGPTLAVSTTVPDPGEVIGVTGAKFIKNKRITLLLTPVAQTTAATHFVAARSYVLKSLTTKADGTIDTRVTIPESALGSYDVVATKGTPEGFTDPAARVRVSAADDNRRPDNNDETTTAFTGFNMMWLLLLAAALVAVGVYANRRGARNKDVVRSIHG